MKILFTKFEKDFDQAYREILNFDFPEEDKNEKE